MLIAIPMDGNDQNSAAIATIFEAKAWALVEFDAGAVKSVRFFGTREDIDADWIDFVILQNKFENYMESMEEGIMVLVVREERTIPEIMEAFTFKELDEIGY